MSDHIPLLRFISSEDQYQIVQAYLHNSNEVSNANKQKYRLDILTLEPLQHLAQTVGFHIAFCSVAQFLADPYGADINLSFDQKIESFLLSPFWDKPLPWDGQVSRTIFGDKYMVYKLIAVHCPDIFQPRTMPVDSHGDCMKALASLTSDFVVFKPRQFGFESKNVILIERQKALACVDKERLNFYNYIVQEYCDKVLWPPQEWRCHFVGRQLCRVMRISDKNNWGKQFSLTYTRIDEAPQQVLQCAQEIADRLVPKECMDNISIDFLMTTDGLMFLEVNMGCIGSMYPTSIEECAFIEPIYREMIRRVQLNIVE